MCSERPPSVIYLSLNWTVLPHAEWILIVDYVILCVLNSFLWTEFTAAKGIVIVSSRRHRNQHIINGYLWVCEPCIGVCTYTESDHGLLEHSLQWVNAAFSLLMYKRFFFFKYISAVVIFAACPSLVNFIFKKSSVAKILVSRLVSHNIFGIRRHFSSKNTIHSIFKIQIGFSLFSFAIFFFIHLVVKYSLQGSSFESPKSLALSSISLLRNCYRWLLYGSCSALIAFISIISGIRLDCSAGV